MPYDDRKILIESIESLRGNRTLICLCNFDRTSIPPLPGLSTQFHADLKECLYRILKESPTNNGIDLFLYTRGGDLNSVWPIVSLLREFDINFEVLVPFRAHSAGTILSLGAKRIVMTRLAELSPIDPTTGNQFNPPDPSLQGNRLGISVEDVRAYQDYVRRSFNINEDELSMENIHVLSPFFQKLVENVHPLALGNVHRVFQLISLLAKKLLKLHEFQDQSIDQVIKSLTVDTCSHLHVIGRKEATDILGNEKVLFADNELETRLDTLLKRYEDDFNLRNPLFGSRLLGDKHIDIFRFIGGVVESRYRGYLFETKGTISQHSKIPPGVQIQVPTGQILPLIPGLQKEFSIDISEQRWHHNVNPEGVTL